MLGIPLQRLGHCYCVWRTHSLKAARNMNLKRLEIVLNSLVGELPALWPHDSGHTEHPACGLYS